MTGTNSIVKLEPFSSGRDLAVLLETLTTTQDDPVVLDASDVSHFSSSCLQLLLCTEQDWRAKNRSFEVVNMTDECRQNLTLMGVAPDSLVKEGVQ